MESGKVVAVVERATGSSLVGAHTLGATALVVEDTFPFSETGGLVTVGGVDYTYLPWVEDGDPLQLTSPLLAAAEDGDPAVLSPLSLTKYATVVLGAEDEGIPGEAIEALVPHALAPMLAEGIRVPDAQETVTIVEGDEGYEVGDIIGRPVGFDASTLDPSTTIPDGSLADTQMKADLDAAEAAIVLAEANAQDALDAAAQAVLDAAAAAADAAGAVTAANGKNKIVFSTSAASGTGYNTGDVWFRKSGALIIGQWEFVSGAWASRTLDNAVIANLNAGKLTAGIIDATLVTLQTAGSGARVVVTSAGLIGYDGSGNVKTTINAATGKITAVDVDVTGTIKATSGEISGILDLVSTGVLRTAASGQRVQFGTSGLAAYGVPNQLLDSFSTYNRPAGLAIDSSGNIYAGDNTEHVVRKFSPDGRQLGYIAVVATANINDIAIDTSGNVYVADGTANLVRKYLYPSGTASTTYNTVGTPYAVELDASGNVYASDRPNKLIRKFTGAGVAGLTVSTVGFPTFGGLAIDASGNIYVGDDTSNVIRKFNSAGTAITNWSVTEWPYSLTLDSSSNVYVTTHTASALVNRLRKFSSTGTPLADFPILGPTYVPTFIVVDATSNIYLADWNRYLVCKYTQGNDLTYTIASADGHSTGVNTSVLGSLDADVITAQSIVARDLYSMGGAVAGSGRLNIISDLLTVVGPIDIAEPVVTTGAATATAPFSTTATFSKTAGVVYASGAFTRASGFSTSFVAAGTIPEEFWPPTSQNFTGVLFNTTNTFTIAIDTAGAVSIRMSAAYTQNMSLSGMSWVAA